ncbi:hypothetical protein G6M50_38015 [Agrobacterium rhizogenes]|nr:hypothetical protein [Rhizobium rhizogenes]NTJ83587.1 hypothetical protein [Rhizobium rhizogenes]
MANNVFFLTAHSNAPSVRERVNKLFLEENRYDLPGDQWMVVFDGTTQELAEKAGIRGGDEQIGTGLALSVTTYSGRANTSLWEWLKGKGF